MPDDGKLLQDYAKAGSEAAFAELVARHLDLVYSTALRILGGDQSLAKDVSQSVFLDLSRKAPALANRRALTGWLYTSTCFAASKTVRSERRRQARELEALSMQEQRRTSDPEPDWERLRTILDTLMLEMKESDRDALLLRFFEKCSLAEVGGKLGLSENAARMRVDRALEKLRDLMALRGITSTAATVSLMLANQTMIAAPVGLAASIASASIAGVTAGGGLSTLTVIAMSSTKTLIVGAVIAAGLVTPVIIQRHANTRLRAEVETLRSQLAEQSPRPQNTNQRSTDIEELARLRRENAELIPLRGEVVLLRQKAATMSTNIATPSRQDASITEATSDLVSEAEITEFLQRPPTDQGKQLAMIRVQTHSGPSSTPEFARNRLLAEKIRPTLEQLENRPSDMADFQSSFIQTAVGLEDENKVAQIRDVIQKTYEKAVAAHLDAPSRPPEGVEDWAVRRDALDRQATKVVQELLTPDERDRFDRLFLGLMGIDLGIGDGKQHRFVLPDGAVVFPSEQPSPNRQP